MSVFYGDLISETHTLTHTHKLILYANMPYLKTTLSHALPTSLTVLLLESNFVCFFGVKMCLVCVFSLFFFFFVLPLESSHVFRVKAMF